MELSSRSSSGWLGLADTETMLSLSSALAVLATGGGRILVGARGSLSGSCATVPSLGTGGGEWSSSVTCVISCFCGSVYWYKFLAQLSHLKPSSLLCVLTWAAKSGSLLKLFLHFPQICGFRSSYDRSDLGDWMELLMDL